MQVIAEPAETQAARGAACGRLPVTGRGHLGEDPDRDDDRCSSRAAAWRVKNMPLKPFFSDAEKNLWLSSSSYLWQLAAGFELWSGGTGLASKSFSVSP